MSYITALSYAQPLVNYIAPTVMSYAQPLVNYIPTEAMPYVPNMLSAALPLVVGFTVSKVICVAGTALLPESSKVAVQRSAFVLGIVASILVIPSSVFFVPLFTLSAGKAFGLFAVASLVSFCVHQVCSIFSPKLGDALRLSGMVVATGLVGGNLWIPLRIIVQGCHGCMSSAKGAF